MPRAPFIREGMQDALPEQGKTSPAESYTLQKFELIYFPLDDPIALWQSQPSEHSSFVALDTAHKGEEFSDARGTHGFPPALKGCVAKIKLIW